MHAATTRSIITAAGLAAIGLIAWPQQATPQRGVPAVHRDVALVDEDTTILGDETAYDTKLFDSVLGPTGAEEKLFDALGTNAPTLLDTFGASPDYSGDFNGTESRLFEGVFIDTLVTEDKVNQLLGISPDTSETAILADLTTNPGPPLPDGDTLPVVGASDFDTDLQTIATGDFSIASSDFAGYLEYLSTLGSLGDLGSLGGDLSSLLGDLTGGLF
jgi:hypothetical protein